MRNFQISATIGLTNTSSSSKKKEVNQFITKGTAGVFDLDLLDKSFTFDQIKQLTIVIKCPDDTLMYSKLYNKDGSLNNEFAWLSGIGYNYIRYTLSEEFTAALDASEDAYEMEAAITINNDNGGNFTMIEKLEPFKILDSLFSRVIGE